MTIRAWGCLFAVLSLVSTSCRQTDTFYSNVLRSDVFFQTYSEAKYDFLWVMDNSGSMANRRKFVADNLQQFVNILGTKKAVDYQMAFVTTDMFSFNGDLVQNPSGLKVVKSLSSVDPISEAASIINNIQDSPTSFWEQGLESAYQAIYKHGSDFFRPDATGILVFLTDEDDFSCEENCFGVEPEHNSNWKPFSLARYITYFQNVKKTSNMDMVVFPIVITDPDSCDFASMGVRYMKVATNLAGLSRSGSICDSKLADSFLGVAKVIADRGSHFKLSSTASGKGINVYVNQQLVPYSPDNYIWEEATNEIVFTGAVPPKGAVIEVVYNQLAD